MTQPAPNFNILATTFRGAEHEAASELFSLLKQLGDENPQISLTKVSGLISCYTSLSPFFVVNSARERIQIEPWTIRYLLRLIPIERVVKADIEEIKTAAGELCAKIGENESFRITVEKRFTSLRSSEIISGVAAGIDRQVDLEDPDWIVMIEVFGGRTGVSVVKPDEVLSVTKTKQEQHS